MSAHEYERRLERALDYLPSRTASYAEIAHDNDCPFLHKIGACACDPDITLVTLDGDGVLRYSRVLADGSLQALKHDA